MKTYKVTFRNMDGERDSITVDAINEHQALADADDEYQRKGWWAERVIEVVAND